MNKKNLLLLILDGWGCREPATDNAIAMATTPQWDKWQKTPCVSTLKASGLNVGLPEYQMGNSEVGHMHIGAGRIIKQNLALISDEIDKNFFHKKKILLQHLDEIKKNSKAVHLIGLVSDGGVHSHQKHLYALLEVLKQQNISKAFIHAILDGRDCAPNSGLIAIKSLLKKLENSPIKLASLCGRFYAMDRDKRWDRTEKFYNLLTKQPLNINNQPIESIKSSYQNEIFDEFIEPAALKNHQTIKDGDLVIFFNFRADRMRQIHHAFSEHEFSNFQRGNFINLNLLTMTEYEPDQNTPSLYPTVLPKNTLGECLEKNNMRQLRIAETEKYAHVTFFLNGGREKAFKLESRLLVNSPKVRTYDLQPQMSAFELTDQLVKAIKSQEYRLIICNYANADMVGHTGDFDAAVQSIEVLDNCLEIISNVLEESNTALIITADHGNAEKMFNEKTHQAHTAHTLEPVPFVYIDTHNKLEIAKHDGSLIDIAPTILNLLDIEIPTEMTGTSLLKPIDN